MFLAGAFGAFLANRGISVFNDAVRPVVPEYREGRNDESRICNDNICAEFWIDNWIWNSIFHYVPTYFSSFFVVGNGCDM